MQHSGEEGQLSPAVTSFNGKIYAEIPATLMTWFTYEASSVKSLWCWWKFELFQASPIFKIMYFRTEIKKSLLDRIKDFSAVVVGLAIFSNVENLFF